MNSAGWNLQHQTSPIALGLHSIRGRFLSRSNEDLAARALEPQLELPLWQRLFVQRSNMPSIPANIYERRIAGIQLFELLGLRIAPPVGVIVKPMAKTRQIKDA